MNPITLAGVLLAFWAVVHFWLLPISKERWVAADMRTKMTRAGSLAVFEKLRDIAAVGFVVLSSAVCLVWAASRLSFLPISAPKTLVDFVGSSYLEIKGLADGYGTALTVLGLLGATYALWRSVRYARQRVVAVWSAKAQEEFTRLREDPEAMAAARADADLRPLVEQLDELLSKMSITHAALKAAPHNEALAQELEGFGEELSSIMSALSIEIARRDVDFESAIATSAGDETQKQTQTSWQRFAAVVMSERFCKDAGLVKKPLSRGVTALLFVSLIGWTATPFADSLQLAINNLRINILAQEAHRDLDAALSQANPTADEAALPVVRGNGSVQTASRLVARAALREMINSPVLDNAAQIDRAAGNENEFVRAAISEKTYAAPDSNASGAADKVRNEIAQDIAHHSPPANNLQSPAQHLESLLQPSLQRLDQENPGRLSRIIAQLETRYSSPMTPLDAQGELLGHMIDQAFDGVDAHPNTELSKQAEKMLNDFGKKAMREWVNAFAQRYLSQAIFETARPDVWAHMQNGFHFEASNDTRHFIDSLYAAQDHGWAAPMADHEAQMHKNVAEALAQNEQDLGLRPAVARRLGGYEQLFPSHDDSPPLAGLGPDGPQTGPGGGGGGGGAGEGRETAEPHRFSSPRRSAPTPSFAQARAMSFRLSALSFRVRGVLIGQDAKSTGIDITDFRWTLSPATAVRATQVTLQARFGTDWRTLGTFDAGVVNQALRYAADRRVVATTITPGDGRAVARLTYLHPALVDTPLGCRIVEADRVIDTFTYARDTHPVAPALAQVSSDRQQVGKWMAVANLAEAVASRAADETCPREKIDKAVQGKDLQARFSPELTASIGDFLDTQEKKDAASTNLLRSAGACAAGPTSELGACLCKNVKARSLPAHYWFAEDHTSQLRERDFPQESDMRWMQMSKDGLGNFDLWLHITFALRNNNDGEPDESTVAAVDFPPVELKQLRAVVGKNLPDYTTRELRSPTYDDFMKPLDEFVVLQRFDRSALAGKLGQDFPVSRLADLARETRKYVPFQRTIRWEATGNPDDLMQVLSSADPDAGKFYASWYNDQLNREQGHKARCDAASL